MRVVYEVPDWSAAQKDLLRRKRMRWLRGKWMPLKERSGLIVTLSAIIVLWVVGVFGTLSAFAGIVLLDGTVTLIGISLGAVSITGICIVVSLRERQRLPEPTEPFDDLEAS